MVEALTCNLLAEIPHGFMTRRGGISTGVIAGLNCGFGADDDPAALAQNRKRAADAVLPGAALVGLHQVHSANVAVLDEPWDDDSRPHADGFVTRRPGVLLSILTADCAPVLFADMTAGVIGAAHAGWRGAHGGVLEATVDAMEELGARRDQTAAAIGPCIAQESYEVDDGFRAQFTDDDERFFATGQPGHWQFDLPGYISSRLAKSGIGAHAWLGRNTYAEPASFYSYRRATHRLEPDYGRQLSLIGLRTTV